jgi:transcriptional regulator with XRE-family HTH domain
VRQAAAFGAALRRERERRGISLEQIADDTKVGVGLLEALERGDLARWPTGIFRRAFVRAYAEGAGLDSRAVLSEFLRIFPDDDAEAAALPPLAEPLVLPIEPESALRLTFADEGGTGIRVMLRRLVAVVLDAVMVGACAGAVTLAGVGWPFWSVAGLLGLAYFTAGIVVTGTSPVWWWLQRPRSQGDQAAIAPFDISGERGPRVGGGAADDGGDPDGEP